MSKLWSPREIRLRQWALLNKGACKDIAQRLKVSPQFVHLVLYSKRSSTGGRVERLLKQKGCPL